MKKIILSGLSGLFASILLAGCSTTQSTDSNSASLGTANPASTYCINQGGKLEIRNETNGQVGYCHLKNGQVVEEWEYFRANQPKCIADQATALVGQSNLTEAKIKEKTKAQMVRMVAPGQPVTMDYREERVTVTVDPATKKVVQASCG
ncbi:I78 family peptidase inhibitor [Acinetobacter variabilis]|uniref:I78 family peptidase inhibitor n=1 Tax=Acinetobacter variabilis TaxID=70346 RepID=UPI0028A5F568|nr:I78 family peptidase inhibitor [Acinetobacter variabilis]